MSKRAEMDLPISKKPKSGNKTLLAIKLGPPNHLVLIDRSVATIPCSIPPMDFRIQEVVGLASSPNLSACTRDRLSLTIP